MDWSEAAMALINKKLGPVMKLKVEDFYFTNKKINVLNSDKVFSSYRWRGSQLLHLFLDAGLFRRWPGGGGGGADQRGGPAGAPLPLLQARHLLSSED